MKNKILEIDSRLYSKITFKLKTNLKLTLSQIFGFVHCQVVLTHYCWEGKEERRKGEGSEGGKMGRRKGKEEEKGEGKRERYEGLGKFMWRDITGQYCLEHIL